MKNSTTLLSLGIAAVVLYFLSQWRQGAGQASNQLQNILNGADQ